MTVEIRSAREEEMEEFNRVVRTAFASPQESAVKMPTEWTLCAFTDGWMASSYAAWPLQMQLTDAVIPVAGVTMVGTLPIYRRRGYLRRVTEAHFKLLHERGEQPIAILNASMAAIYQRYGYAIVSTRNSYTTEPRYLHFSSAHTIPGDFREAGESEMGLILELYHRFMMGRTGYLRRNEAMEVAPGTPFTVLRDPEVKTPATIVVYREQGEPLGYVIYSVGRDERSTRAIGQRLVIRDLVWLSASAYRAIWDCFFNMDLVHEIYWHRVSPDDPLPHLLLETRMLNINSGDGLLGRIVDVDKALPRRSYSERGILTFEVIDELCPWNGGRWKMETSESGTDIKRTTEEPQVTMPVSTLAMLVFGQVSPTEAARMACLDVHDHSMLSLWDRVMKTQYRPFCADLF